MQKEKNGKTKIPGQKTHTEEKKNLEGYPLYPASEDIYSKLKEEKNINPEEISKIKESNEDDGAGTRKGLDFNDNKSGSYLDVPGSELDDAQENIGSEDEENNYYSLGGDDHNNLDEDKEE